MCSFLGRLLGTNRTRGKVVDGVLVLSLPDAVSPLVCRIELEKAKDSVFEIAEQDGGVFALVRKSGSGAPVVIAPFAVRSRAVRALMSVSGALEQAPSSVAGSDSRAHRGGSFRSGKWGPAIIAFLLLIGLVALLTALTPQPPLSPDGQALVSNSTGEAGVPVTADSFLQNR
ncbi:MAG: hypothetical protein KDJ15_07580 [Alphaproteobacteria bacterium]|nr:hypothetical protein [Alphaproteobacteria bacterium]